MIYLLIDEEYGYRYWEAALTEAEWAETCRRWRTLRNLTCLVPVPLVFPQATEIVEDSDNGLPKLVSAAGRATKRCHLHDHDDSWLTDCGDYEIPYAEGEPFRLDGREYSGDELLALLRTRQ